MREAHHSVVADEPTDPASTPVRPEPAVGKRKRPRSYLALWLILPAALLELLVHIIPMLLGVWIGFLDLDQYTIRRWVDAPFVGLQNFVDGLDSATPIGDQFLSTIGRTLLYTVIVVGGSWVLGMAGAVFLSSNIRGRGLLRTLFLVPYALPSFVGTLAWAFMFGQQNGAVNSLLVDKLHLFDDRPFWLIGDNAFPALIITSIWAYWPFAFLMLLAALQVVPSEVYEAAEIDGASRWKQFWLITLPMIKAPNAVMLLVLSLWIFNQFNIPYVLFGGAGPDQAKLISPLIYESSFVSWNFGVGGAMSFLLLLVLLVASFVYIRLVMPKGEKADA
ncbi:carbohydrate ABC transporter permease [Streptomyces sp. NPDC003011]